MKLSQIPKMSNLKVMLQGEPGAGKTCFATSFPAPIYVFDFDSKINSAARYHDSARVEQIDFDDYRGGRGSDAFDRFEKKLAELESNQKLTGKQAYNTIIIDSLTQLSDVMLEALMKRYNTKRGHIHIPSMQDYQYLGIEFKNYIHRLLRLDCNIVINAHIQINKDEITGEILRMPQMNGTKTAKWLPTILEEVYYCHRVEKGSAIEYVADSKNEKFGCRSQIPGLPKTFSQNYASLTVK